MISYSTQEIVQASGNLFCCFSLLEDLTKFSVGIGAWVVTVLCVHECCLHTWIFFSSCGQHDENLGGTGGGHQEAPLSTAGLSVISSCPRAQGALVSFVCRMTRGVP